MYPKTDIAVPVSVTASAAAGVATTAPYNCVEGTEVCPLPSLDVSYKEGYVFDEPSTKDTITLLVKWKNIKSGNPGTAIYTCNIFLMIPHPLAKY